MNWSLVAAVNDKAVLQANLLASPDAAVFCEFIPIEGAKSAGEAYNAAWALAKGDILVFAHQDIFLPAGWAADLERSLAWLAQHDAQWGVLGVFGRTAKGLPAGHTYCTGLGRRLGSGFAVPTPVRTLDEIVLILRRDSGLRFDAKLPGFHLYATDICLKAQQKAMTCYTIPAFCIHNTNGLKYLPRAFCKAYAFMRSKWWTELPVRTPCTTITRWCWPLLSHWLKSLYAHAVCRRPVGSRVLDPSALSGSLFQCRSSETCGQSKGAALRGL
jgi:Glycosyltransferase like family